MKKKSKFLVFLLSPLPGLSHLYLGWNRRALVFFTVFLGLCASGVFIDNMSYHFFLSGNLIPLLFFVIALVWFIALAEALGLAGQEPESDADGNEIKGGSPEDQGLFLISNRKMIALAFSTIPGAGHMFLGLLKQGAQLMAGFFLVLILAGWLNIGLLTFVVPVIWFYSVFDIYHLLEDEKELHLDSSTLFDWFSTHPGAVGWGLIILGLLVLLQRIINPLLEPLLSEDLRGYMETVLVAVLLIGGGIKLLAGSKVEATTSRPMEISVGEKQPEDEAGRLEREGE
ncbi:MAG TPA: hypothetical protein DD738_05820 [Ruminiclostridium sp.]|nr:hypothetical protein [Ruminiclostridium sp.]